MQNLATGATTARSTFTLSEIPLEETIQVTVDSIEWFVDWTYDPIQNAIVFDINHIPSAGSEIEVTYGIYGDCD